MIPLLPVDATRLGMRGKDEVRGSLFSYVDLEHRVRPDHPLRTIRAVVNAALAEMSAEFDALFPGRGVTRSRLSGCCAPCCCRPSTRSVLNVSWWSG